MNTPLSLHEIACYLPDEAATEQLARSLASTIGLSQSGAPLRVTNVRIHLRGDLGSGKTAFTRAFLRACGVTGRIKSPSYALLESYKVSNLYFYHLDFYRFSNSQEWEDAGFREILHQDDAVVLIEWPEQAGTALPPPDIEISLTYAEPGRQACLNAYSNKGQTWLTSLVIPPQEPPPGATHGDSL